MSINNFIANWFQLLLKQKFVDTTDTITNCNYSNRNKN